MPLCDMCVLRTARILAHAHTMKPNTKTVQGGGETGENQLLESG